MKNKLKEFFSKKGIYYEPDEIKDKNINPKEIILKLQKENEDLKKELSEKALNKFKTRRSIRKFSEQPVDWKIIYNIIEGAINAPCAGNIQNYKIIVVEDKIKKHEIGKIAFQQYWLSDAPVLLVVARENYHLCQLYPQEGDMYSVQNSAAMIENLLMLTHFYNLGACWVEGYDNDVLKEYLGVPGEMRVDAIIPIGYPLEDPKLSKDPTYQKVFFETYGNRKRK